jgi:hypothetical protein
LNYVSKAADPFTPERFGRRKAPASIMDKDGLTLTNLFSIQGRNALVTGATSGIGYMMAEGLIVNGVETLFIIGHHADSIVQEKVSSLQKLADDIGLKCKVFGCVVKCVGLN